MIGIDFLEGDNDSLSRIVQGLTAEIGFIGGRAILKTKESIEEIATAVSIWNTGAIAGVVALLNIILQLL